LIGSSLRPGTLWMRRSTVSVLATSVRWFLPEAAGDFSMLQFATNGLSFLGNAVFQNLPVVSGRLAIYLLVENHYDVSRRKCGEFPPSSKLAQEIFMEASQVNNFRSSERNWIASRISFGRISREPDRSASVRANFRIRSCARAEKFISSIACSR